MDVIEAHARRLPPVDERWRPREVPRDELERGLLDGRVAGVVGHPLDNVTRNAQLLLDGDPDKDFGMTGVADGFDLEGILRLVDDAIGSPDGLDAGDGRVWVDPSSVLASCGSMGDRLLRACDRGESVVLATGHPVGLGLLYLELARILAQGGAEVLQPGNGVAWEEPDGHREIRYLDGVALLTDRSSARHTHAPDAMERMLADGLPDLVVADHGFAGAAIHAGVETVAIADVNDPALLVARALGRTEIVVVMDDNVAPDAYWPCFQAVVARLR
jgi:hypothetical protein